MKSVVLGLSLAVACAAHAASRPHVVIVLADDLGWHDVGYHSSEIATPSIDRLAAEGVRLEQFYATPACSTTRSSLLTGRYPIRQGLQAGIIKAWAEHGLPIEERTLAQGLREAGYSTVMVGKWHLGVHTPAYLPLARGFDHHYGSYTGSIDHFTHRKFKALDWHRDGRGIVEEGHSTTLIGREAVRVIQEHDESRPLFLFVAFNAPHRPLQAPQICLDRYAHMADGFRRTYAAMVSCMDDEIGRIVNALEARGMRDNSLIIFMSDNGGAPRAGASNRPLRGGKGWSYEGGVRVPALVAWRGKLAAGRVVDEPLHVVDWYPTLLRLAAASLDQPLALDGRDIWPSLTAGAPSPHDEILLQLWPGGAGLRRGDWKLVISKRGPDAVPVVELFDLSKDPSETTDLSGREPERLAEMQARLDAYRSQAAPMKKNPRRIPRGFRIPKVWGQFD